MSITGYKYAIPTYRVKPTEVWGENWARKLHMQIMRMQSCLYYFHLSDGNDKIGSIWNFNLPALVTCPTCAHHTCGIGGCYALKEERYLAVVVSRWENLAMALKCPERLEEQIIEILTREVEKNKKRKNPKRLRMRIHESGDFNVGTDGGAAYLAMWLRIARRFPEIEFYWYTKCYDLMRNFAGEVLGKDNIAPYLSAWPGLEVPADLIEMGFKVAYLDDGTVEIPEDVYMCPATAGNDMTCEACGYCPAGKGNVGFHKH